MRSFRLLLLLWLSAVLLHGQISVGSKQYDRSALEQGAQGEWVLYEKGAPQNEVTRRWLTKRVLVELAPDVQPDFSKLAGVKKTSLRGKYAVVEFDGQADVALEGATNLRKVIGVRSADPMLARQLYPRFTPNDPLYAYDPAKAGYQWHLNNTGENDAVAGIDLNIETAWDNYDGFGVRIGIVDDGLEVSHPDLASNVDLVNDYDFNDQDNDPSPGTDNFHGTACAGVAAAVGNNGIGVSGVAPAATLVGMRLIAAPTTDQEEADAFALHQDIIDVKSNSWGPFDNGYGEGGPGPLSSLAMATAATTGRTGKGTIFLWAAGNGNGSGDDSNYDGWANSPYAIAVSAIDDTGEQAWYSEPGANILVCAPSDGGTQAISTTDISGSSGYNAGTSGDFSDEDYTNSFGGTSSSTPAVAGVAALMLEANPALTYRDVQEILVQTAVTNDSNSGNWITNGAGLNFHINYGAGLVDATAATDMAATWTNLPARQSHSIAAATLDLTIPDGDTDGVTHTFTVPTIDSLRLEHVTVQLQSTHANRGDLEWRLISPSGVNVRLARSRINDTSNDLDWTFMATHFWGEYSEGDWKLQVIDRSLVEEGTLDSATITFYGTPITGGLPLPVITSRLQLVWREGGEALHQMTASNMTTSYDASGLPDGLSIDTATGIISGTPSSTGLYFGSLSATNATGTTTESTIFQVLAADPLLSEAVEQPESLKIVSFGYGDWFQQTTVTHDGTDAAQSGAVAHDEYSGMEFSLVGPSEISFQWKVSSEENYDYLVFTINGELQDYITGEVDWTEVTAYVGAGTHVVDIYYLKDQATIDGDDAGWVDELVITPTTTAPAITVETIQAYEGVFFRYQLFATNAPDSFTSVNLPAGLTLHPSGLVYGSLATEGSYNVTIEASNTFGTDTETFTIQVDTREIGLAEAIDAPAQVISSSGDALWIPQTTYASDGEDSARSGVLENEQESIMTTQVTGPCKVVFYWGVSSEADYDFFRFYIDDVEQAAISGELGWTRQTYLIGAGVHTLKWRYSKDEFVFSGLDSGFVDQFSTYLDSDNDGFYADEEAYFGTSDQDPGILPRPTMTTPSTDVELQFPSVIGNDYHVEYSDDLVTWERVTVTATGSLTTWIDTATSGVSKRFYRVVIP